MIETYGYLKRYSDEWESCKTWIANTCYASSELLREKMEKCLRVRKMNEPIAEQTKMGWIIMFPGRERDLLSSQYTKTSVSDLDRLCDMEWKRIKCWVSEMDFKVEGPWNIEKYYRPPWLTDKKMFWILGALEWLKQ